MTIMEVNKYISDKYGDCGVLVDPSVWPEFEALYLAPGADKVSKQQMADFYQKFDYQGVRNAMQVTVRLGELRSEMIYGENKPTLLPSQVEWLKLIGWHMDNLKEYYNIAK